MPELPEVETIAKDLRKMIAGLTIAEVKVDYGKIVGTDLAGFAPSLTGRTIGDVGRIGKWLKMDLDSGFTLLAHLKMTGQFVLEEKPGALASQWPAHARVGFKLVGEGVEKTLFYLDIRKFGRLRVFDQESLTNYLDFLALGPDPLNLNSDRFHKIITSKKGRLKQILLDQTLVSGLGNIYADESLFAASLSPNRTTDSLTKLETAHLLAKIQAILTEAIEFRGSTVENYRALDGPGSFQDRHQVYGKSGKPCPKCGQILVKIRIGGRGTVHCPACQT
ncbi:MAG: bifunctional DNA-formamidopyrimidine glycosylase/DNA-(apurinic or apyrimidinic site) lyase [Deltaproteobacteria bacterium]|jgi:formamidopyrimidine-DNA glycosylase|nr:bifunctional DNA-formamidopyrimidine glycosylase/DNA-(apurinic or apyrimidinic site) lyase [Deltaproteobacteria bacterium]